MSTTHEVRSKQQIRVWEKNLIGIPLNQAYTLLPGVLIAGLLAWFSIRLSNYIGITLLGFAKSPISAVMMAILL